MVSEEQFIGLFVKHEAELRAFAMTLLPQPAEADDLLQESCIAMWRKIDTLESQRAFRSWAYTYVRFTALNRRRKQKRSPLVFSDQLVELMASEEQESQQAQQAEEQMESLAECLSKLEPGQKALVSRYYANRSTTVADLSAETGRPIPGLYKTLERIRGALRTCMEGHHRANQSGNSLNRT